MATRTCAGIRAARCSTGPASIGLPVRDWQDVITVNMLGRRFYDETGPGFTTNNYNSLDPYTQGGWRNVQNVTFRPNNWLNAAMAGIGDGHNGGGPIWAIFDADAVRREEWVTEPPHVDRRAGFFFSADTLAELADRIVMRHQRVRMPPENLEQTVARYNGFVESGVDEDFGKPRPLHKIATPPFFAAWATPVIHDTRMGLRIDAQCRVVDLHGQVIPGLYCGGEFGGRVQPARPGARASPGLHRRAACDEPVARCNAHKSASHRGAGIIGQRLFVGP